METFGLVRRRDEDTLAERRFDMRVRPIPQKHSSLKIILYIGLLMLFLVAMGSFSIKLKFALQNCLLEGLSANVAFDGIHVPPSELLISPEDLPSQVSFISSHEESSSNKPRLDIGRLFSPPSIRISDISYSDVVSFHLALESSWVEYVISNKNEDEQIIHDVYWFGTNSYSYCRYEEMTKSSHKLDETEMLTWDSVRYIGTNYVDSLDCYPRHCVWTGKYREYVTVLSAPVGQGGISMEEFKEIIQRIDRKMSAALGK